MTRSHQGPPVEGRLPLLTAFGIFGSQYDDSMDRIATLAAETFGTAVTTLAFIADDRYVLKGSRGLAERELPREPDREHPMFLSNTVIWHGDLETSPEVHPRFGLHPEARFAASCPILCPEGRVLGRLIIMDPAPRLETPTMAERNALAVLGALASREIVPPSPATKPEEATTDSSDFYRSIFEENPSAMWVVTPQDLGFRLVNRAARATLGLSQDEVDGMSFAELIDGTLSPGFRACPSGIARLRTRDGQRLTVELQCRELAGGVEPQLLVVAIDVTERQMAEAALTNSREALRRVVLQRTATLDALPIDVALIDETGRIMFVNRTWRRLAETGYFPDAEKMTGGDYIRICEQNPALYGGNGVDVANGVREVLTGSRDVFELEAPSDTVRGVRWFRVIVTPVSAGSRMDGAVVLHIDITDARRAAAAIEAANQLKSQFLANTSHELRTPLNAVIGFSELIKLQAFGPLGERYVEYVDYIHASGHHLLEIINDLLDLSKIEAGQMSLNDESVRLLELVDECIDFLRIRMVDGKLNYEVRVASALAMRCDRLRMKQILLNLLSNAVKFTPEGGQIVIAAGMRAEGGLSIEITDTGVGMDEEGARLALEPFVQIHSSLSRRSEGTGLGLSLVNRLIALHGGSLEIVSQLGQGTTVRIFMPAERSVDHAAG